MISATERVDTITIILPINEEDNKFVFVPSVREAVAFSIFSYLAS